MPSPDAGQAGHAPPAVGPGSLVVLAIEATNPGSGLPGEVLVARAGVVLSEGVLDPTGRHDDALMPAVAGACAAAGISPRQIGRVVVSTGPGGYTSCRIAVTAAKLIAEASGCGLVGVPTALGVVRRIPHGLSPGATVSVCLAWKRGDAWRQRFAVGEAGGPRELDGGALVPLREVVEGARGDALVIADAELAGMLGEAAAAIGASLPATAAPVFSARAILEASAGLAPVDPAALVPLYPREPEAVSKWRTLKEGPR
ncbi:MAG: tRNA (adenosine(37)-N6)-threonylcarbamoyltransferase complex dimerization subunit type 1 TsaB [Phycisphaerales bacterium]|nr:tRNA (adenosine(37)-N6)-threonylcarbamoyltransferase complex dimerization subunit type 1 TsaB [Phycisphaerales bacterium]